MLLALVLASTIPPRAASEARLLALDRARHVHETRLAAALAPLAQLLATAQRLAARPPALTLARPGAIDDMLRTRALIAALSPEIRKRSAAVRRELLMTEAVRAETAQALAAAIDQSRLAAVAQSGKATASLVGLPSPAFPSLPAARSNAAYRLPTIGTVVVGMGEMSEMGIRARGLTLATKAGAVVGAPAKGRIAYAGPFRGYGDIVILNHGRGWTTLLAGLELVTTGSGEVVDAGAPLGHMGRGQPRLTIELRHNGRPIDVAAMVLQ